jgi:hypothetical protein
VICNISSEATLWHRLKKCLSEPDVAVEQQKRPHLGLNPTLLSSSAK